MTLEEIQKKILHDATAKASEIGAEAEKERAAILEEAKRRADEIIGRARSEAKKRADAILKEHEAALEVERHNSELTAQEEAIMAQVPAIKKLVEEKLATSYGKIVEQAARDMKESGVDFSIMTSHADRKLLEGVRYEVREGSSGIAMVSKDGKISIQLSPSGIVDRNIDIVMREVARELFKQEKGGEGRRAAGKPATKRAKNQKARKVNAESKRRK